MLCQRAYVLPVTMKAPISRNIFSHDYDQATASGKLHHPNNIIHLILAGGASTCFSFPGLRSRQPTLT